MRNEQDQVPTSMPTDNRPINAGKSLNDDTSRLDSVAKVTGRARFGRDVYLPKGIFAAMIRCPFGAAELKSIDTKAALAVPGALGVEMDGDRGRYHGQPVGRVFAESRIALRRGLAALNAQWTPQPVKTRITDEVDAPPELSERARTTLAAADHVLEAVYSTPVQTHASFETHGAVVDHRGDAATMYVSTQGTFAARDGASQALGLPASKVEVRCEYVGGGFGSKLGPGKEGLTAVRASTKFNRPAWCFVDRDEEHLDTGNRPSSRTYVNIGFARDGTILGGRVQTYGGVGVARRGGGARIPSGRYDFGTLEKAHSDVQLNGGAPRPMRAPGAPQGAFAEELMIDEIATIAGADPIELRQRLIKHPDHREMFRMGAEMIGWKNRRPTGSQTSVIRRGFGAGSTSWGHFGGRTEAEVVIHRDGSVEARTGTQDIGTGQRTVMGVVAAKNLGVPLHFVTVRIGNSTHPIGPASGGSVTAHCSAPTMMVAADDAKARLLKIVAERKGLEAGELDIVDGRIVLDDEPVMSWAEACSGLTTDTIVGRGDRSEGMATYGGQGHSHGVQFVDLDVDAETGGVRINRIVAIQACGLVVCRKTAESQIIGGVIQGIGFALMENKLLDRNLGAMVNANLESYKIPGAADIPRIEPVFYTKGQTGVRSLGEPPTIPTAGAIACAVFNAIGSPVRHLPLTPDKILAAMEGGAR